MAKKGPYIGGSLSCITVYFAKIAKTATLAETSDYEEIPAKFNFEFYKIKIKRVRKK